MFPSLGLPPRLPPRLFAIDAPNGTGKVGEATRPVLRRLFLDLFRYGRGQSTCHAGCRCPPPGLCGFGPRCAVPTPARQHGQADEGGPVALPAGAPDPRASVRFGTTGRRGALACRGRHAAQGPRKRLPPYRLLGPLPSRPALEVLQPPFPSHVQRLPRCRQSDRERHVGTVRAGYLPGSAGPGLTAPPRRCASPTAPLPV
jgi:hypothetical protein